MTVLTVIFCFVVPVQAIELGGRVYWWFTSLDGEIKVDSGSIEGTKIDVSDDLGLEDEDFPVIEIFVGAGKHQLCFAFYNLDFDGDNRLDKDIAFNGEIFNLGDQIRTTFDADVYDIRYHYEFLENETLLAGLSLELVARVAIMDGEGGVVSSVTASNEEFTQPIPFVGINLDLGILADLIGARLLATCGYYNGPWIDGQAEIAFHPLPFIYITGGYRILYFNIDVEDLELDSFNFAGPYVGLTVRW